MIIIDGIIYHLNSSGGIAVLYNELISRLPRESFQLLIFDKTPKLNISNITYFYNTPRILERYRQVIIKNTFDLFHSTYYRLPAIKSGKVVTTVHDYIYERFASSLKREVHSFQKKKSLSESDKIICVSECTRNDLLEFSGRSLEDKTVVIHNGVSEDYYFIPEIDFEPQVIFVGQRSGYKNFHSLIYALAKIKDVNLVCVGGGDFNRREIFLMEKYLKNRYSHKSFLSNASLNLEYNRSLCLVYPSLYEGFGIPILEAMKAGCPVIAVNKSSIPEVAGDAAVLMEMGQPDEISESIQKIMSKDFRDKLVSKGFLQAKKFGWEKTYKKTINLYEELTGKVFT